MKLLFVHGSNALKEDEKGNYYTDGSYSEEVWERYYSLANNLTVMTRKEKSIYQESEAKKRFHIFDKEKYQFVEAESETVIEEMVKKSDAVIVRVPSRVSYKAIDYAKKFGKKYLLEIVGCPFDVYWNDKGLKNKILAINSFLKLRRYSKEAEFVLYVSERFLQRRYPTNGKSIGCSDAVLKGLDESLLNERIERIKAKKDGEEIVLCTVGTVDLKIKGQRYVIEAISEMNKQGYKYKYYIVGGGDSSELKAVAEKCNVGENVIFTGMLPHDEVFEYMKKCDVYVQPSESEGLPRVMVEAISVATPCIVSKVGGNPELIDEKFVFKAKSVKGLVEALKLMDRGEMIEQAKRNFETAKRFEEGRLNKAREEFYKLMVE